MKLLDKLLLGALVILLPLGLFLSQWMLQPGQSPKEADQVNLVDTSKLEQVIKNTISQNQPTQAVLKEILITSVSYASESATLSVGGKAPVGNVSIFVSAAVPQKLAPTPTPNIFAVETPVPVATPVLSKTVKVFSIDPESSGVFNFEYPVPDENLESLVVLRFDQDASTKTIQFDLKEKKQVY